MPDNEEVKPEVKEEVQDVQSEPEVKEEVKLDRPEENYKAELARKNAEIARLRAEREAQSSQPRRDANDISTWTDHELKTLANSNDPQYMAYKDQAQDLLLERKYKRYREQEKLQEKRAMSDLELRTKYPESLDPASEFSARMEQVIFDLDLQKSPAGRLAAAKIVAAETSRGKESRTVVDRNSEASRIRDVRSQMTDGDRSRPPELKNSPKKAQELENRLRSEKSTETKALKDVLDDRGINRENFFKR